MKRREFITLSAKCLGGVLIYTLGGEPMLVNAQDGTVKVPLRFFSADEAGIVSAACERILPGDESGPGAKEAGVVIYIDRQLAGPYGRDKYRYTKGPWVESDPEHGYQGQANPQQVYREGITTLGANFASLTPEQQDAKLHSIETSYFFKMLRQHTIEGMFSDPLHGGNANLIGWQMVGYPGPLMSYRNVIGKFSGEAWRKPPVSLEQVVRRPVKGWEDEPI